MDSMKCDLCQSTDLKVAYISDSSQRNLSVYLCPHCGLVQSWPRLSGIYPKTVSVTSGAGWGYVRYGKEQRTEEALAFLDKSQLFDTLVKADNILDIGSNRGHFLCASPEFFDRPKILHGVEPHLATFTDSLNDISLIKNSYDVTAEIFNVNVEDYLPSGVMYDFIYCSHTLEHVNSASNVLSHVYNNLLSHDGLMFIEVPNLDIISQDQPNEFFIDNHLYHFSWESLEKMLLQHGFCISSYEVTPTVIRTLVTKSNNSLPKRSLRELSLIEKEHLSQIFLQYNTNNNSWLNKILKTCESLQTAKINGEIVVAWGAARTLNYLIEHTTFKYTDFDSIVDKNLCSKPRSVLDRLPFSVSSPSSLTNYSQLQVTVFIASIEYIDDIKEELRHLLPDARYVTIFT